MDVTLSLPPESVRVALALALAATVEEQHAVAMAGQHLCVVLRSGPTGERDHAAPFFDGMYQPFSFRPSLVVNSTFS